MNPPENNPPDLHQAKQRLWADIDDRAETLLRISHRIWDNPELCFEEHLAHETLTAALAAGGLDTTTGACGLDTAFLAEAGTNGPTIAVICEYDALPGIGHACGHNIIAAAGVGAGLALAPLADELGGKVRIVGTPAEEGGGGKAYMIEAGAFEGVDAALMIHPANHELLAMSTLAVATVRATYAGVASHAAASPHLGRNALDAAVLGYMGVAALRQHIRPSERIHGVFSDGGDKPNIVPLRAETFWFVRSVDVAGRDELMERVKACLSAGAQSAGCEVSFDTSDMPPYDAMVSNDPLMALYAANAVLCDRVPQLPSNEAQVAGSTDMGNVSQLVPSIHPMIKVAPDDVPIHTAKFAEYTRSDQGDAAVLDGAKMLAATVLDLWQEPESLKQVKASFAAG